MAKTRPLDSFYTAEEKAARRRAHADVIADAVAALEDPDGFRDWIGSLILCDDLSPLNCALVARRLPGQIVTTKARWKARGGYSILAGQTACVHVTAPGFIPKAAWTADQVGAGDLIREVEADPPRLPCEAVLEAMHERLRRRLSASDKPNGEVATFGTELRAGVLGEAQTGNPVLALNEVAAVSDEIPF